MPGTVIQPATHLISMDEPCFGLAEMNLPGPAGTAHHRYQILYVIRSDRITEYREDLGVMTSAPQFRIPGGVRDESTGRIEILHTVGELIDIANALRAGQHPDPEPPQPHDLITGYHNLMEERKRLREHPGQMMFAGVK